MHHATRSTSLTALAAALLLAAGLPASAAESGPVTLTLFQPGQSSWEWLLIPSSHDGGKRMREGKSCLYCHAGEEQAIGNLVASGEKLEPSPVPGLPGTLELTVRHGVDDQVAWFEMSWQSPDLAQPAGDEDAQAMATVMIGTPELPVASIAGCWAACHSDMPAMPDDAGDPEIKKYLPGSRTAMTRTGGGRDVKSPAEIQAQLDAGEFLEIWRAKLSDDGSAHFDDGYFLDTRKMSTEPAVSGTASRDGQRWTVRLERPLAAAGNAYHELSPGQAYTVAFAVHTNHASDRHHYVSFPMPLELGGAPDTTGGDDS